MPGRWACGNRRERTSMENRRFDALTRRFSSGTGSRREALKFAACGAATGLLGAFGFSDTAFARKNCTRSNRECNLNRPGKCCSRQCCFYSTGDTSGTCSSKEGTCCSERSFGGYCPREFPMCCGSDRCCPPGTDCCFLTGGRGTCCDPGLGQTCIQGQGCVKDGAASAGVESAGAGSKRGVGRGRSGNL